LDDAALPALGAAILKYDDASWHYGGDFPSGLPDSAGATHIGMFVAWAVLNGLAGPLHTEDATEELERLEGRSVTPGEWFLSVCDGKFTHHDLNDVGNQFALAYYEVEGSGSYLDDYGQAFPETEVLYYVPDSWATFSVLEPLIRTRFETWRNSRRASSN
jgi:hypothetical protein